MAVPLEIVFHGVDPSEAVERRIAAEAEKLERHHDRITACRVVVEAPHRRHSKGNLFEVHLHITLPGHGDVVVNHNHGDKHAHEDPYVAVRDAFAAARRQLQDFVRVQQGKVKTHEEAPVGHVVRLFADQGYGFIESADGRDIYFHKNSVLDEKFVQLDVGSEVRFSETEGAEGPQASTVHVLGRSRAEG